jgi:uncharacterized protein YceH (UPF0502 family)
MTFVPTLDAENGRRPRVPRTLDAIEIRVLGALMEKQLATPEYYPLTLNALLAACNQKSNREPVMELKEDEVQRALDRLQDEKLVWRVHGGRAVRFDHNLDAIWHLKRDEKALMTLLFLRGPQTAGDLRGRSDRLASFDSISAVEDVLRDMAAHSEPLVRELPRRPGQKEQRWVHTVGGVIVELTPAPESSEETPSEPLSVRVRRLEEQVESLSRELQELKAKLGE